MFSKIFLLFILVASSYAKSSKKPQAPPTKKPQFAPTFKPSPGKPSFKPSVTPTFKPTSAMPTFKPTTKPTVFVKTTYSNDYPNLNDFIPINGTTNGK